MAAVRRLYIYLISAISLQAMVWALIMLVRSMAIPGISPQVSTIAFEIAVIVIGLPIFLVHWLWGQRLARQDRVELEAGLRRFYFYGTLAGFLGPILSNGYNLFVSLLGEIPPYSETASLTSGFRVLYHLLPLVVLSVLWWYHEKLLGDELKVVSNHGTNATIERLYRFGFSTVGLTLTCLGCIHILRRLLYMMSSGSEGISSVPYTSLKVSITRLVIGAAVWLAFWLWSQRLFADPSGEERSSVLRKFYLYGAVFAGVLGTVGYATTILAGILRRALSLDPQGDLRVPIPIMAVMVVVWAYHAYVLRQDQRLVADAPRQAGIRRIYLYLVAGVGLAALLVGLGGVISVFLRAVDQSLGSDLREQLAWFSSAVIAGLPVWLLHWRQTQHVALVPDEVGESERSSLVRKIYLYFYIFVATLTVLSSLVYIVYRIFSLLLGEAAPSLSELGQAIAFCMIAFGVWLYHGASLRMDGRLAQEKLASRLKATRILLVGFGRADLSTALLVAIRNAFPGLSVNIAAHGGNGDDQPPASEQLAGVDLIVLPWSSLLDASESIPTAWKESISQSSARKLLLPAVVSGWDFAGVEHWEEPVLVQQAVHAISQMIDGEEVKPKRPMGAGAVIGLIVAGIIGFILLTSAISMIVENF